GIVELAVAPRIEVGQAGVAERVVRAVVDAAAGARVGRPLGDVAGLIARAVRAFVPRERSGRSDEDVAVAVVGIAQRRALRRVIDVAHRRRTRLAVVEVLRARDARAGVLSAIGLAPRPDLVDRAVAARRALPFGFTRQPAAAPLAERLRLVPRDVDERPVVADVALVAGDQ